MKRIKRQDCTITVTAEQDHIPVRGNAMASGDDAVDSEVEDEIIERLNNGDVWAWALVTVTVEFESLKAAESVGGCSYENEEDFKKNGGYDDMVDICLAELNKKAQKIAIRLK